MALWSTLWCSSWIYLKTVAGKTLFVNGAAKLFALCSPWWQNAFVIFADSLKIILTDKSCSPTSWKDSVSRQDENECRSSAVRVNWNSPANVVEVADLLMDAGCHLNQPDANGVTSLQLFQELHRRLSADGILDTLPTWKIWFTMLSSLWPVTAPKLFVSTKFLSKNAFRPLSSPLSKDMANCLEFALLMQTHNSTCIFCAENIMFCFDVFVCHYSRTSWII